MGGRSLARPLLLLLLLAASAAHAHLGHVVLRAERYLKFDVEPRGVRLVVSLTLGADETVRIARAADANADEVVSDAEAESYMAEWGAGLREDLPVEVDGEPFEVTWGEAYFHPVGAIQPVDGAVEMVAHVPLDGGRHTVTILDRMRVEAFDRTDVKFEAQPGMEFVASGVGPAPTDVVRAVAYTAPTAPERLSIVVERPEQSHAVLWGLGGAGLLSFVAWAAVLRRRKSATEAE
ncbi:MAG: hypothetical protein AAGE52_34950 [Myxococcota bacterium]